ncbi:MAG TPA: hypothetical protein PKA64_15025, partial [Myxococcota bacterium]|nr:hypothetical protein [Myxococcota bacterium]
DDTFAGAAGRALELRLQLGPGSVEARSWGWLVHAEGRDVAVAAQVDAERSTERGEDAPEYGRVGQHDVLVLRWTPAGDARARVVFAEVTGEPEVSLWPEVVVDGVEIGG